MERLEPQFPDVRIGHAHDLDALTGVTVILCPQGAVGGVDQRGGAPGTRETDALHPMHLVEKVHALVLSGGSAFGLDSASGVVRYLEERSVGFDVGVAKVPIVPAAILFDLGLGRADVRPGPDMGYQACLNAVNMPPQEGCVGAGAGCSVGKVAGLQRAMKSGIGFSSIELEGGLRVAAVFAVNAFGDVIDPENGSIVAGARWQPGDPYEPLDGGFLGAMEVLKRRSGEPPLRFGKPPAQDEHIDSGQTIDTNFAGTATVIGAVITNAQLTKEQANKVAQMAQDGLARAVRPAHTMVDGDTIFALGTGEILGDVSIIGAFAAESVSQAILRAVRLAKPLGGLPGLCMIK